MDNKLLKQVSIKLDELEEKIKEAFPLTEELIRKVRKNKDGSINRVDIRYYDNPSLYAIRDGCIFRWKTFNPSSHKQLIEVLHNAGWQPSDRTKTHMEFLRNKVVDKEKKLHYNKYGWKIN